MRRSHLEALRPLCLRCLREGRSSPLGLAESLVEDGEHVLQGVLRCAAPACQLEYPVVDGVPIIVPDVRAYVSQQSFQLLLRDDLHPVLEGLVGDCCGPGSSLDVVRQHLSHYTWDHWADLDPAEEAPRPGGPRPGRVLEVLERGLELAGPAPAGPTLDAGSSLGRTTFALAARREGPVLGVDLNYPMVRLAARILRSGQVSYGRRRVGVVYDRRTFAVPLPHAARVDFWACDATALPFAPGSFGLVTSLNLLDCVASPLSHLEAVRDALAPGGRAVIGSPYDWSPSATAIEGWVGGHSQRGPHRGQSEPVLRALLTPGAHPASVAGLRLLAEDEDVPWQVRLHERSVAGYRVHLVAAERA